MNRRAKTNLLANSLTARLGKVLPEYKADNVDIEKIKSDSVTGHFNQQYTSDINRDRLNKESAQFLKRQKHLNKQREVRRRTQERIESSIRSRSGFSSASLPPLEADSGTNTADQKDRATFTLDQTDSFPEFASVDKDDQSNVKVFKLNGIFQPTNKYKSRIEPLEITPREKPSLKENNIHESLKLADNTSPSDLPSKSRLSKKGLRVSWSRQSRYYPDGSSEVDSMTSPSQMEGKISHTDVPSIPGNIERENHTKPQKRNFNSRLSFRSDSFLLQKRYTKGRQKIETIGLKWKIKPGLPSHPVPEIDHHRAQMKPSGISHNLMPVTTAIQREGRDTRKVCWQVQKLQSISTVEMYKAWLQKLEMLKTNAIDDRLNASPSRSNFTAMTQPV